MATYEGEHNHKPPWQSEGSGRMSHVGRSISSSVSMNSSCPATTAEFANDEMGSVELQKVMIEQMAATLAKDPNFRATLANAISGRIYELPANEN